MLKKKVLVVVAHPDDEILWMGGSLIRNKNKWNTTVVSFCRASDRDRYPKFKKVCKALDIKGIIYDFEDKKQKPIDIKKYKNILEKFSKKKYDMIFTHGKNGEYDHIRHKEVHKAIKQAIEDGILKAKKIFFFSYKKRSNKFQGYAIYNSSANIFIKLNRDELAMKRRLAIDVYGYDRGGIGFEENSVGPIESFDEFKK